MFRYLHYKGLSVSMHEQKFRVLTVTLIASVCFIADAAVLLAQAVVPEMGDTPEFVWTFVGLEAFPCFCVVHVMGPRFFKRGRSSSTLPTGGSGSAGTSSLSKHKSSSWRGFLFLFYIFVFVFCFCSSLRTFTTVSYANVTNYKINSSFSHNMQRSRT